jgi:hypothetical protein
MAWLLIKHQPDAQPIGKYWIKGFKKRNPEVKSMMGRKLETSRVNGVSNDIVTTYFDKFQSICKKYSITQANTWNMDEHGMGLGICTNSTVLCGTYKKRAYTRSPQNSEWATVIECASATGESVRPTIIFKGKTPQTTWFDLKNVPKWPYTCSQKAWITTDIAITWLKTVFMKETDRGDRKWRLLILDNHSTHRSPEFVRIAFENRIRVFYLPAHSSHVLQPLDICFFSPLKRLYRAAIARLAILDEGAPVKKQRFVQQYELARNQILDRKVVLKGWKGAGLWPWNPELVLGSVFVPTRSPDRPEAQETVTPPQSPSRPVIQTPRRSTDVMRQYRVIKTPNTSRRATDTLVRKSGKVIDELTFKLAQMEHELAKKNTHAGRNQDKTYTTTDFPRS